VGERKRVRELVWVVGLYLPGNSSKAIEPVRLALSWTVLRSLYIGVKMVC